MDSRFDQMVAAYIALCKEQKELEKGRMTPTKRVKFDNIVLRKNALSQNVEIEGYSLGAFFAHVDAKF